MPYLRETVTAGKIVEVREYHTARYGQKGGRRERQQKESEIPVQVINHRNSERKLRGLLNANFETNDWFVTLTYRQGSRIDEAEALKDVRKLLRKLKKVYIADGRALKYIYVVERLTRTAHIHIVLPYLQPNRIRECWLSASPLAKGAHFAPLYEGDFAAKLASYMLKEYDPARENHRKPTGVKFHCSRNLQKPVIEKRIMKRARIPKAPYIRKGYILLPDSYYEGVCAFTGCEYRSYTLLRS